MFKSSQKLIALLLVACLGLESAECLSEFCPLSSELGVGADPNAEALAPRAGEFPGMGGAAAIAERRRETAVAQPLGMGKAPKSLYRIEVLPSVKTLF